MSKTIALAIVLAMAGLTATARADGSAGAACAAGLAADGKAIYAVTVAAHPTLVNLRSIVVQQTRHLVMDGKIDRDHARDNATAAGDCAKVGLQ